MDNNARILNLLGALSLTIVDALSTAVEGGAGHGGEAPAALVTLGVEPGISINELRQILKLSHSGAVRLLDRLEAEQLIERRSGSDGRTVALYLTEAGQTRRSEILTKRREQLNAAIRTLNQNDRENLTQLLEKMLAAMTTDQSQYYAICRLCEEEVCPMDICPVEQAYCQSQTS